MTQVLPKGWEEKTLGDMCDIFDSKRRPITQKDRIKGEYPYYGATAIVDYVDGYLFDEPLLLIGEDGAKWGKGEECAFIARGKYWVNNHAHILKPKNNLSMQYLVYWLNYSDLSPYITGTTVPKLNQQKLKNIKLKFPSLPEQKRIVEKLDKIFANIDKAKEQTTQNLKNAQEVLESFLKKLFTENIKNWEETTFEKEIKIKSGDFLPSKSMNNEGKYEVYGGNGIAGYHDTMNYKGENVIIGRVGEKCGNVHYSNKEIWVTDNAFVVTNTKHDFDKKFLCTLLQTAKLRKYAAKSTHPVISGKSLRDVKLCFPASLQEQQRIIKQVAILQEQTQELETTYTKKLADLDELKQTVLQQAFSGKL